MDCIETMWKDDPAKAYHLDDGIPKGRSVFDYHVGFGQYPISVLDHATGMATLANHGRYNQPHFVLRVERKNRQSGNWERIAAGDEHLAARRTIDQKVADEVTYVLKKIPADQGHTLANGRQVAAKSGTWENGRKQADGVTPVFPNTSAHAWYVGYTEQIATATWVGSKDHNDTPIKDTKGNNIFGAGLPGDMWEAFMNKAHKDMQLPIRQMTNGTGGKLGDPNKGEFAYAPSPSPTLPRPTPSATQSPKPKPSNTPPPPPPPTPTVTPAPQRSGRRVPGRNRAAL